MRYFELSQTLLHQLPTTFNIHELTKVIDKLNPKVIDIYVKKSDHPKNASWGTGVYELLDDGSLKLISSYWDTTD